MTTQARQVLADCKAGFDTPPDYFNKSEWRRWWVTQFGLLRAVGHVLDKIDRHVSPAMATVIKEEFQRIKRSKPEPKIFWQFIETKRNDVLKEYRFRGPVVVAGGAKSIMISNPLAGEQYTIDGPDPSQDFYIYSRVNPFAGRDMMDLVREAIAWWEQYLDRIDHLVGRHPIR